MEHLSVMDSNQVTSPVLTQQVPAATQQQTSPFPKKRHRKTIFFSVIAFFTVFFLMYLYLAYPYQISGEPVSPFRKNQYVLTEKLSYMLTNPKAGDRVIFVYGNTQTNFVGVVLDEKQESGKTLYQVCTPSAIRPVPKEQIKAKIYYPFLSNTQVLQTLPALVAPTLIEYWQIISPSPSK